MANGLGTALFYGGFEGFDLEIPLKHEIEKVIFNERATIVIWKDGVKTVVKCMEGEPYDKEKGLYAAIAKRTLGNKDGWYSEIKKWVYNND